jgi:cell wall-associated NlpC family hydrolase
VGSSVGRLSAALAALAVGLAFSAGAGAEPPSLADKEAEAQQVLAQVHAIDVELEGAAEAYNRATIDLDRIEAEQKRNAGHLVVARTNLKRAQRALEGRLVALYTGETETQSPVEVLLGATNVDDLMDRLETVERVSGQDAAVLGQVKHFRTAVQKRKVQLAKAQSQQAKVVAARAAHQTQVEAKLRERQALLSTIQDEIAKLQAEERRRQALLEQQARARIAAQRNEYTSSDEPAESTGPLPAARYGGVVGIAMQYLGVPYVWGGASPGGFDCSGFVMYVYAQIGVSLPHNAAMQYGYGTYVPRDQLQPGDLVFFNGLGHDGIYIGSGQFIHAPHTGDVVKISSLSDSWYASTYYGAKRL